MISYRITARSSASSKRACVNVLMPAPKTAQTNAQGSCLEALRSYNWHRPHGSIGSKPPISRVALDRNNLLRLHV